MIVVTGGAGFIGSNIIEALNKAGHENILVVDDLTDGTKFTNIVASKIMDYMDKYDFIAKINADAEFAETIEVIFHEGACSTTTEWDGEYMMANNYQYSKDLLHYCLCHKIPFIYASSAATYGNNTIFVEAPENEAPINVYGYSKFLFDQYVRRILPKAQSQIVGTRYFNVYGPHEQHKDTMASVAYHFNTQLQQAGEVKLFEGCDGYGDGEQLRDFVYVEDAAKVNLWFWKNPNTSGIFNLGTGNSETFNAVADAVIDWHGKGKIKYIPFPEKLRGCYQSFTEADLTALRAAGYKEEFKTVADGVKLYLDWLNK